MGLTAPFPLGSSERMHKASWEIAALFLVPAVQQQQGVRRSRSPFTLGVCGAAVVSGSTAHLWKQVKEARGNLIMLHESGDKKQ